MPAGKWLMHAWKPPSNGGEQNAGSELTVVALVLVLRRLGVPVVALGMLGLAVVALVLVHRLGFVLRRLGVAVVPLVLVRRLRVVLGLACAESERCVSQIAFYAEKEKLSE